MGALRDRKPSKVVGQATNRDSTTTVSTQELAVHQNELPVGCKETKPQGSLRLEGSAVNQATLVLLGRLAGLCHEQARL